ncbi:MAG: ABC transporter substrate-binding protein [Ruminococcus sp.]
MKKLLSALIAVLLTVTMFTACTDAEPVEVYINENNEIYIGVLLPSGDVACSSSEKVKSGIEYAHSLADKIAGEELNSVSLVFADSTDVLSAIDMFTEKKIAGAVALGTDKNKTDEIISAFSQTDIPLIFIDNCSDLIADSKNVYSIAIPMSYQLSALTTYISNANLVKGVVICTDSSKQSKNYADTFETSYTASANGVITKLFAGGEENTYNIQTVVNAQADFIVIFGDKSASAKIAEELKSQGITAKIMLTEIQDKSLLEKEVFENIAYINKLQADSANFIGSDFINTYSKAKSISQNEVTSADAYGYDAYMLLYTVLSNLMSKDASVFSQTTSYTEAVSSSEYAYTVKDVASALKDVEYYGVTDLISFNGEGEIDSKFLYINEVISSKSLLLEKYNFS